MAISYEGTDTKIKLTVHPNLYQKVSDEAYKSILCIPITARGECFGVLNIETSKKDPFGGHDYRSLAFFASMVGLALDRSRVPLENNFF